MALFKKSGGFEKYWRFSENQADLKNWHFSENQADLQNIGAWQKNRRIYEILAPGKENRRTIESWRALKSLRLLNNQRDWKILAPAYCLGLAESPAADFLLDWLKSSCSDPRRCVASLSWRPQVRTQPRLPCFYGRTLSRTVPAACTGPTCQNSHGSQNSRRPRKFSPIPVKSQKS